MENNNSKLKNLLVKTYSYKISNDYKKAIDCYDQVLQIDLKYTEALNYKEIAYYNLKKY